MKLRELNREPTTPGAREVVYCTKVGTTRPDEMYSVGAHMDGHGWGEAANDDDESPSAADEELAAEERAGRIESGGQRTGMGRPEKPRKPKARAKHA